LGTPSGRGYRRSGQRSAAGHFLDQHLKDNPESQKELDRRITKALNTAHEKWEQEAQQRETEAAKLAKMTAEQKERY